MAEGRDSRGDNSAPGRHRRITAWCRLVARRRVPDEHAALRTKPCV